MPPLPGREDSGFNKMTLAIVISAILAVSTYVAVINNE